MVGGHLRDGGRSADFSPPSVARYRADYLEARLERAQIASLALLASDGSIAGELAAELLDNAGVFNVVLRRDEIRELVLASPLPGPVDASFDLRNANLLGLTRDALQEMTQPEPRIIRIIGNPVQRGGLLIEITLDTAQLQRELWEYGGRILALSLAISLFYPRFCFTCRCAYLWSLPMSRVIRSMSDYAANPEDATRIMVPQSSIAELREAEEALQKAANRFDRLVAAERAAGAARRLGRAHKP